MNDAAILAQALGLNEPLVPLAGGRTNRVWRAGLRVIKLYTARDNPLFANDPDLEFAALRALAGTGLAPEAEALHQTRLGPVLVYRYLAADDRLSPDLAAQTLTRLHALPVPDWLPKAASGDAVIASARGMIPPGDPLHALAPPPPPPGNVAFLHMDPVPGNMIVAGGHARLIDWQCPAAGDPAIDIAHALSPAMHMLYGKAPLSAAWRDAFMGALPEAARRAYARAGHAHHWRIACYCRWQAIQGNTAYGQAAHAETEALLART